MRDRAGETLRVYAMSIGTRGRLDTQTRTQMRVRWGTARVTRARARRTCVASTDAVARDDAVGGDDAVDRARGGEQSGARRGAAIDDDAIDVVGDIIGIVVDASGIVDDRARGDGARTRERDGWWWCGRWCGGESRGG